MRLVRRFTMSPWSLSSSTPSWEIRTMQPTSAIWWVRVVRLGPCVIALHANEMLLSVCPVHVLCRNEALRLVAIRDHDDKVAGQVWQIEGPCPTSRFVDERVQVLFHHQSSTIRQEMLAAPMPNSSTVWLARLNCCWERSCIDGECGRQGDHSGQWGDQPIAQRVHQDQHESRVLAHGELGQEGGGGQEIQARSEIAKLDRYSEREHGSGPGDKGKDRWSGTVADCDGTEGDRGVEDASQDVTRDGAQVSDCTAQHGERCWRRLRTWLRPRRPFSWPEQESPWCNNCLDCCPHVEVHVHVRQGKAECHRQLMVIYRSTWKAVGDLLKSSSDEKQ